jgi:hypothetical protein
MLKKLMLGTAALVLGGSLATAGDVMGIRLEAGLEIGEQATKLFDEELDYSTLVFQPYVQLSRYGTGPCFSLRVRGLFSVDEDTDIGALEATVKTSGYDIQALGGKFTDFVGLHAGVTYERFADETQEFEAISIDSEDELNRIMAHVGVVFTF